MRSIFAATSFVFLAAFSLPPSRDLPAAIYTDPSPDPDHPARMEVLHIPSGGVEMNGVAYLPAGAGLHPALILLHGFPGNEKSLDLAQAVRRAGWTVVTVNYRGSWGSPGNFSFANALEDGKAAIAFVRDQSNAERLRIDPRHVVVAGHSMGGWIAANAAADTAGLRGAILISAANMGNTRAWDGHNYTRSELASDIAGSMESLAGTSAERMADELISQRDVFDWTRKAGALARTPLLVLSSEDGLAPATTLLADAARRAGGEVTAVHVATDHSWSDSRIRLQDEIIRWLNRGK